jgi:hypothetical protein
MEAQQFLRPNEKLLWVARPDKAEFTKLQWPMVVFGLIWSAITFAVSGGFIYLMFFADQKGDKFPALAKPFIVLFFVPFWAVGLYMLGGHKWVAAKSWKKILYMLTSENIIIHTGKSEIRLDHEAMRNIQIDRLKNGLGTIRFLGGSSSGPVSIKWGKFNMQLPVGTHSPDSESSQRALQFQAIADPDAFLALAQKIVAAKQTPAPQ